MSARLWLDTKYYFTRYATQFRKAETGIKIRLFIVDIIHAPFSKLSELGTEHAATGESIRDVFLVVNQRLLPPCITISNKTIRSNMKKEIKYNKNKRNWRGAEEMYAADIETSQRENDLAQRAREWSISIWMEEKKRSGWEETRSIERRIFTWICGFQTLALRLQCYPDRIL
jgi:hypothetical protein